MDKRTFVISDIHGKYDMFIKMLKLIDFNKDDILYILGDVIDRGEEPIEILDHIMRTPNIHFILGNHETMLLEYLNCKDKNNMPYRLKAWMKDGGLVSVNEIERRSKYYKERVKNFLQSSLKYKIIDKFILVHGGLNMPHEPQQYTVQEILEMQEDDLLWIKENFFLNEAIKGYTVIFGHSTVKRIRTSKGQPVPVKATIWHDEKYKDKIGIDCGAVFGGRLSCLCLNDMKEYYIE